MSGVEILALVTSVMTVITFAGQTAQICNKMYSGKPTADEDVYRKASSMRDATITMKRDLVAVSSPASPDELSLADIANKCHDVATALQREVASLQPIGAQGHIFKAIKGSFKAMIGKSKVEKLEKSLREYENTMQTHLLVNLW